MLFFLLKGVEIPELKINEGIRAKKLLVIAPDGVQIGELELKKALIVAEQLDLDLVEVSPESKLESRLSDAIRGTLCALVSSSLKLCKAEKQHVIKTHL